MSNESVQHTELLARGVLVHNGNILLTCSKKKGHMFLPGGHIEYGESAKDALVREIEEEIGSAVEVKDFLAAVEHQWRGKSKRHCEINLIFSIESTALSSEQPPQSREPDIEFLWQPLNELLLINLQPSILRQMLPGWLQNRAQSHWGSTIT